MPVIVLMHQRPHVHASQGVRAPSHEPTGRGVRVPNDAIHVEHDESRCRSIGDGSDLRSDPTVAGSSTTIGVLATRVLVHGQILGNGIVTENRHSV